MDKILLAVFGDSPTDSARAWEEKLDIFLQQPQVSKDEAIRIATLHFVSKALAWWIFECFSLKIANSSSYARFIETLLRRFDGKVYATHMERLKHPQTKPLHVMRKNINSDPLHKPMKEINILQHTFLEAKPLSQISEQEGMEISFSRKEQILERLPIHVDEEEGNSTGIYRVDPVPHAEEGGALAPHRGILVSLQEIPQDLPCRDQGTAYDTSVPLMVGCRAMEIEGGDREDD